MAKVFNVRLTGDHSKTEKDVESLAKQFDIIIAAWEDIGWQDQKPEAPHVHVMISTSCARETVAKKIKELGYNGNAMFKVGRPVEDIEKAITYACKGRALGDIENIKYFDDIEKIEEYNDEFWAVKTDNDKKFKQKLEGLRMSILKKVEDRSLFTNTSGYLDLDKLIAIILKEYKIRKLGYSYSQIEKYINLVINEVSSETAIDQIKQKYEKFNETGNIKIGENKNKLDYYKFVNVENEDSEEDEIENKNKEKKKNYNS